MESVHFAPEFRVLPLVQRRGSSLIQRIGERSLSDGLALTAGGLSCVSVLVDCCCSYLDVPLLRSHFGQLIAATMKTWRLSICSALRKFVVEATQGCFLSVQVCAVEISGADVAVACECTLVGTEICQSLTIVNQIKLNVFSRTQN